MKEHVHSVNGAVTGLSALPSTAQPMASVKAMSRFLNHEEVTLPALIEPVQEAIRSALLTSEALVALVISDWCMYGFNTHQEMYLLIHFLMRPWKECYCFHLLQFVSGVTLMTLSYLHDVHIPSQYHLQSNT